MHTFLVSAFLLSATTLLYTSTGANLHDLTIVLKNVNDPSRGKGPVILRNTYTSHVEVVNVPRVAGPWPSPQLELTVLARNFQAASTCRLRMRNLAGTGALDLVSAQSTLRVPHAFKLTGGVGGWGAQLPPFPAFVPAPSGVLQPPPPPPLLPGTYHCDLHCTSAASEVAVGKFTLLLQTSSAASPDPVAAAQRTSVPTHAQAHVLQPCDDRDVYGNLVPRCRTSQGSNLQITSSTEEPDTSTSLDETSLANSNFAPLPQYLYFVMLAVWVMV